LSEIIDKTTEDDTLELHKLLDAGSILEMRRLVRQVPIASHVKNYAVRLVLSTHPDEELSTEMTKKYVRYGSSPRGAQSLVLAGKARALLQGRYNTAFEDIKEVAKSSLRHRIILNFRGEAEGIEAEDIINDVLEKISVREA
jgi:MoxR-like ATPase